MNMKSFTVLGLGGESRLEFGCSARGWRLALMAMLTVLLAGCESRQNRRLAGRERRDPLMGRALAHEHSGDIEGAIDLYRQVVLETPGNAEAHFSLAVLLHDLRQEYVEAIYHYQVFLRLRPGSDKADIARDRIRKAERLFRVRLADRVPEEGVAGIDAHTAAQLRILREQLAASEAARRELDAQLASAMRLARETEQVNRELAQQVARLQRRLDAALIPPAAATVAPRRPAVDVGGSEDRREPRTYEVRPGDSLTRIADQVYGDPSLWRRIRDANPDKVDAQGRIRTGQILTIP